MANEKTPAAPAAAAPAAPAAEPNKGKRTFFILVIVSIVVLLLGGGGYAAYYVGKVASSQHDGDDDDEDDEEEEVPQKVVKKQPKKLPDAAPTFIKLDKFTVNLKPENGENGFMQAEISLQVEGPEADDYLKSLMPRIRNDITLIMSDKQASDLASKEGKVKLAAEVRDAINLIAGPPWRNKDRPPEGPVIEVLFESIITQ